MGNEQSVKESDSLNGKKTPNPTDEGQIPLSEFEKRVKNLQAEHERKRAEEIEELREEFRGEMESRLEELRGKEDLSRREEAELGDIESQLRALDANPKAKVWDERIKRNTLATMTQAEKKRDYEDALIWVEETAEDLPSSDELSDAKKLERAITARLKDGRWSDRPLRVRVKKAWKEINSERKKAAESEEEKKRSIQRSEESGLTPFKRKTSDYVGLAKEGKLNDALDSIFAKQAADQRKLEGRS